MLQQLSSNNSDEEFNDDGTSNAFDTDATSKAAQSAIAAFYMDFEEFPPLPNTFVTNTSYQINVRGNA